MPISPGTPPTDNTSPDAPGLKPQQLAPVPGAATIRISGAALTKSGSMLLININPTSEHELFLTLFVSNAGGW
jgi:hypothetical protein